ncbi:MAG: AMP-binding protein [Halieaceae bacterium]|nr:AMP-binding protein [Halieaceae bacterium]
MYDTLTEYLDHWAEAHPDDTWLTDRHGDTITDWSWSQVREQAYALAAWQEAELSGPGVNVGLLSRNCAHWFIADIGTIAAGNVTVPMFTTLPRETAEYVMDFTDMQVLFVGQTENWEQVSAVLPEGIKLIALPGATLEQPHLTWDEVVTPYLGKSPSHRASRDDLVSIVFTSGTTGLPKGVMQTHASNVVPINRFLDVFVLPKRARKFSYLPLSHIAERQIVEFSSLVDGGSVYFNENLLTILRDLPACKPHIMFGAPRVWEQLQQVIIGHFGGQEALDKALAEDAASAGKQVQELLGLEEAAYLLTAAAPTPPALIHWYEQFGLILMEGFGQTEAMGLIANSHDERRIGSIGKPRGEVEVALTDEDELICKANGLSPGYYKMPEKTAETFKDGWVYTGDKARIDEDGFVYLTGRVKDYFKTIQGKFVAPTPIENEFSRNPHTDQICLLGRGYSKTVMVCVLNGFAQQAERDAIEADLMTLAKQVNDVVDKHARLGAVIISTDPWSIENAMLTPTLKIRREQVEMKFGERAQELARQAAEQGQLLVEWL